MLSSTVIASGEHTSSASASNIAVAGPEDIILSVGQVLEVHTDVACRIRFGGLTATATAGHFIPENVQKQFECDVAGTVSVIDLA